ncbi:Fms-interacting protein-domain-containing protein [Mycena albidolilacea]|uniref:Fms-interacting protein-domain-containing protein n=1 Tax=Mycena albidolilacea TaxID=1033008 RepID=A0AAD7F4G9_9AGAR|nr:Fms-interacting protein-domain-containing protein [Mycena albidolilacea]
MPSTTGLPEEPYVAVIDNLRELVDPQNLSKDSAAIHIRAAALTGRLKSLARAANTATRHTKNLTAAARHDMDQSYLGLQNLLYEKRHLEREIEKCRQFASVYQDIPLYTLDKFELLAPPEARSEDVLSDEHQLLLNRLSFEFVERQRLDKMKRELVQQKEELLKESKAKLTTMDNIKSQIETLAKVAAEVQKKVDELALPIPAVDTNAPG